MQLMMHVLVPVGKAVVTQDVLPPELYIFDFIPKQLAVCWSFGWKFRFTSPHWKWQPSVTWSKTSLGSWSIWYNLSSQSNHYGIQQHACSKPCLTAPQFAGFLTTRMSQHRFEGRPLQLTEVESLTGYSWWRRITRISKVVEAGG